MKIQHPSTVGTHDVAPLAGQRGGAATTRAGGTDGAAAPAATVDLSIRGRELHAALQAASRVADVRTELVRDVRDRIDRGVYGLEPEAIARRILDRRA